MLLGIWATGDVNLHACMASKNLQTVQHVLTTASVGCQRMLHCGRPRTRGGRKSRMNTTGSKCNMHVVRWLAKSRNACSATAEAGRLWSRVPVNLTTAVHLHCVQRLQLMQFMAGELCTGHNVIRLVTLS